jgi:multidrug resistance efflux pump
VVALVKVSRGSQVKAGEVLLELDADAERADVAQMQAAVDVARARLDELREGARPEEVDQARRDAEAAAARSADAAEKLAQAQSLLKTGATTRAQALEAQRTAEAEDARARAAQSKLALLERGTRKTALASAAAELARARAVLAQAQARLALRQLVAPVDGTVVEVRVKTGEAAGPEQPAPVVLSDLEHLEVKVDVPEARSTLVRVGDPAAITVEALGSVTFAGHVTEVGLEADRQKGTVEVTVAFDAGSDTALVRPRMAARATIDVKRK